MSDSVQNNKETPPVRLEKIPSEKQGLSCGNKVALTVTGVALIALAVIGITKPDVLINLLFNKGWICFLLPGGLASFFFIKWTVQGTAYLYKSISAGFRTGNVYRVWPARGNNRAIPGLYVSGEPVIRCAETERRFRNYLSPLARPFHLRALGQITKNLGILIFFVNPFLGQMAQEVGYTAMGRYAEETAIGKNLPRIGAIGPKEGELLPNQPILFYTPGMGNNHAHCRQAPEVIANILGVKVHYLHNPTHSILMDLLSAIAEKAGITYPTLSLLDSYLPTLAEKALSQGKRVMAIGFSQGAIHLRHVLKNRGKEEWAKRLDVYTYGPGTIILPGKETGHAAIKQTISINDPIPKITSPKRLKAGIAQKDVKVLQSRNPQPFDHVVAGPTYGVEIIKDVAKACGLSNTQLLERLEERRAYIEAAGKKNPKVNVIVDILVKELSTIKEHPQP